MAEFKFSCPHCGQNIECDEQWAGNEIACPACSGKLTVPRPRVVATAAPSAWNPDTMTQARAAVQARKEKPPMSKGKLAAAWTGGILAFAVFMYFGSKVANKFQAGFDKKTADMAAHSDGGELGHIATVYKVLNDTDPDKISEASARSRQGMINAERAMAEAMKPQPDPTLALSAASPSWTLDAAAATIPSGRVNGSSGNTPFHVETVRLDRATTGTLLSFQESPGTTNDHEIIITLQAGLADTFAAHTWNVTKDTKVKDALPILKKWTLNPRFAPVQKSFTRGYVMKLELDEPTRDWQQGRIYLALPDTNKTVLGGEFSIPIAHDDKIDFRESTR